MILGPGILDLGYWTWILDLDLDLDLDLAMPQTGPDMPQTGPETGLQES